jgi:K+-sensing histidine kinase KdpD
MTDKVPRSITTSALVALVASCVVIYVGLFDDSMSTTLQVVLLLVGVLVAGAAMGYTVAKLGRSR